MTSLLSSINSQAYSRKTSAKWLTKNLTIIMTTSLVLTAIGPVNAKSEKFQHNIKQQLIAYFKQCAQVKVCNGSYLVAEHGNVLFSGAYGAQSHQDSTLLSEQSQFDIGSITKQFTATAVMRLNDQSKLKFDDNIQKYLPELPYQNITVRHLLTHTSGVPNTMKWYNKQYRRGKINSPITNDKMLAMLVTQKPPLNFKPGEKYQYSNTGYALLALIIERVADQKYESFLQQQFFKPLKMKNTLTFLPETEQTFTKRAYGFLPQVDNSKRAYDQIPFYFIVGGGGIYSTTHDLFKWDQALTQGIIVSKSSWKQATTPLTLNNGNTYPYGFGWGLKKSKLNQHKISHGGHWRGFKAHFTRLPERQQTIIALTNNGEDDSVDKTITAVEAILNGKPFEYHQTSIHWPLYKMLNEQKTETVKKYFHNIKTTEFKIDEDKLNMLGYYFLGKNKKEHAITVFELSLQWHPNSTNAHDSLAEAYIKAGNRDKALLVINKLITIDPQFHKAQERLNMLKSSL